MSIRSDDMTDSPIDRPAAAPAPMNATRPLYWSVRRELWENRSIYIAPPIAAGVVLLGFAISLFNLPHRARAMELMSPEKQAAAFAEPYSFAAAAIVVTAFIVAVFYCLGALHGERRDRSVLFWKSLPVSDLTTVISKASIPMLVLPAVSFVTAVALQLIMLLLNTVGRAANGLSAETLWAHVPLIQMDLVLLYGLVVLALWHAPIFGWLLLVSGWAKRTPILWALLPPLALCLVEKIAFNTGYLGHLLLYRLGGAYAEAFDVHPHIKGQGYSIPDLDPVKFLSSPGLWLGLIVAAALFAATVWQRRYREPI